MSPLSAGSSPPQAQQQATGGSYTLSVVRLADPTHAQLSMLNVTDSDSSYSVRAFPIYSWLCCDNAANS